VAAKPKRVRTTAKPAVARPRGAGAPYVYDELRRQILNLELEPGALLDETELSRRFAISRSPVREALIRLSAEGLVKTLRNRSSIVAFLDISEILGYFDALDLMYRATARLAAETASEAEVAAVKAAAAEHRAAVASGDVIEAIATNQRFYASVADAAGNPFFAAWTRSLLDSGQRILRFYQRHLGGGSMAVLERAHDDLVQALERRDPAAAGEAARRDAEALTADMLAFLGDRRLAETEARESPRAAREARGRS